MATASLSSEVSEPQSIVDEKKIKFHLQAFIPMISETVACDKIIAGLTRFNIAERRQFRDLFRNGGSSKDASNKVLEKILEKDEPGIYRELLTVLEEDYPLVAKVLNKGYLPPKHVLNEKKLQIFMNEIVKSLNPMDVLPPLYSRGVISQTDMDEIIAESTQRGRSAGVLHLVLNIPCHIERWYENFLICLYENSHAELAENIDPDFIFDYVKGKGKSKLQEDSDQMETEKCDDTKEHFMSDYQEADSSSQDPDAAPSVPIKPYQVPKLVIRRREPDGQNASKTAVQQSPESMDCDEETARKLLPDEDLEEIEKSVSNDQDLNENLQNDLNKNRKEFRDKNIDFDDTMSTDLNHDTESSSADLDNLLRLDSNKSESFDQQKELNQIVSEYKVNQMLDGRMDVLHGDDTDPALSSSSSFSSSDSDDPVYKQQPTVVNKKNMSSNNLDGMIYQRQQTAVNENNFSGNNDSSKKENIKISLRKYQQELAWPAIQGKNVIIVAPTGSGKTRVACRIIQEHFQQMKLKHAIGKVILLVRDVALSDQHGKTLQELLQNYRIQAISGDTKRNQGLSLKDSHCRHDILVVTAQLLLNSLMNGEIDSITQFSLMIFDECHHCHDEHSYNIIMQYYIDIKLRPGGNVRSLPQIIGLTASVGVGNASDILGAKYHIVKLMANLDAELISTVKKNQQELQQYVSAPSSDAGIQHGPETEAEEPDTIIHVPQRTNDAFRCSITVVMNAIENLMRTAEVVKKVTKPPNYIGKLNAPSEKGSEPYIQWISEMWKNTVKVRDPAVRRFIRPCYKHLKWYNEALIIYNDARMKDALEFLKERMDDWQDRPNMDANEQCLLSLYTASTQSKYTGIQKVPSPKLEELKRLILKSFREKSVEESRCIVFVKTRVLAGALVSWMTDTPELNELSPTIFVGANATKDEGGITRFEQDEKLAEFRRGRYKIMVATSVAEEGLDIQQCNLVLRYDHVTNEIAMVQSRGRARAMDSKYHVLSQIGKGTAAKEELNIQREKLMKKAIHKLQKDIQQNPLNIGKKIRELQEDDKLDRDLKAQNRREKQATQRGCELRCIQCDEFICMSSDIRKILNAHNVVVDKTLWERVSFTKYASPIFKDDEIEFNGKIYCSNSKCHEGLGQVCLYRHQEYPVIKIESFIIVTDRGEHISCKKWKQVPFEVPQLTHEDRKKLVENNDLK